MGFRNEQGRVAGKEAMATKVIKTALPDGTVEELERHEVSHGDSVNDVIQRLLYHAYRGDCPRCKRPMDHHDTTPDENRVMLCTNCENVVVESPSVPSYSEGAGP